MNFSAFTNRDRLTDLEDKPMVTRGRVGRGVDWEFGMDMHTLLLLKSTTSRDLLYSAENPVQYSVIT